MKKMLLCSPMLLVACTSSYEGVRLPSDGNYRTLADKQAVGVPFTLTKPEFTIKKIDGSDPERYEISVAYVPDPDQRYALRVKPTWFSKIDFNLAFGPGGGLTSSSADITDQAVPFATSVVKLAASLAPVFLSPAVRKAGAQACLAQSGLAAVAKCAIEESRSQSKCADADATGITTRLDRALITDKEDKGAALGTIFARTDGEKTCFAGAEADLTSAVAQEKLDLTTTFHNAVVAAGAALPPPAKDDPPSSVPAQLAQAETVIAEAAGSGDVSKARKLIFATDLAKKGNGTYLKAALSLESFPSAADAQILWNILVATKLAAGTGADPVQAIATGNKVQSAFAGIATMTPGQWRARYIPVLQFELAEAEQKTLMATSASAATASRATESALRRTLAAMVNMSADYGRLEKLDAILARVPSFGVADRQSRIAEYQGYEKEAAAIRTDLATRLTAATAAEQAKKKDTVLAPALPWVSRSCITHSQEPGSGWIYTAGAEAPDFVIVMRNAAGDIQPPPMQSKANSSGAAPVSECGA